MKKGFNLVLCAILALTVAIPASARHKNFKVSPLKLTDLETGESSEPAMTLKPHSYRAFKY